MFSKHEVRFSNLLVVYRGPMMKESEGPLNRDKQFLCAPSIRVIFDSMIRGIAALSIYAVLNQFRSVALICKTWVNIFFYE